MKIQAKPTNHVYSPQLQRLPNIGSNASGGGMLRSASSVWARTKTKANILLRPSSPQEVAQRRVLLRKIGAVSAVLAGAALVVGAAVFPPAAPALGVLAGFAFMLGLYAMASKRSNQAQVSGRANTQGAPAANTADAEEAAQNVAAVERYEAAEAISLVDAVEGAEAAEVLAAVDAADAKELDSAAAKPTAEPPPWSDLPAKAQGKRTASFESGNSVSSRTSTVSEGSAMLLSNSEADLDALEDAAAQHVVKIAVHGFREHGLAHLGTVGDEGPIIKVAFHEGLYAPMERGNAVATAQFGGTLQEAVANALA